MYDDEHEDEVIISLNLVQQHPTHSTLNHARKKQLRGSNKKSTVQDYCLKVGCDNTILGYMVINNLITPMDQIVTHNILLAFGIVLCVEINISSMSAELNPPLRLGFILSFTAINLKYGLSGRRMQGI